MYFLRISTHRIATMLITALISNIYAPLVAKTNQKDDTPLTTYARLAEYHLPSLAQKEMVEDRTNDARRKENAENIQKKKIKDIKPPELGSVEKMRLTYHLLGLLDQPSRDRGDLATHEAINDLELVCGPKDATEHHLFNAIDNTVTSVGKTELQKILLCPQTDVKLLKDRQTFIKTLVEDEKLFTFMQKLLEQIKSVENDVTLFWRTPEEEVEQFFQQLYYDKFMYFFDLSYLNKNVEAMQLLHSMQTIGNPAIAALWPFMGIFALAIVVGFAEEAATGQAHVWRNFLNITDNFFEALSESTIKLFARGGLWRTTGGLVNIFWLYLIYGRPLITACNNAQHFNNVSALIHAKMNSVAHLTNSMFMMGHGIEKHPALCSLFPEYQELKNINSLTSPEAVQLVKLLKTDTFKDEPTVFSLKGRVLAAYKMMESSKDTLIKGMCAVGTIDAYLSIAKLYKKHSNNAHATYCFVDYKTGTPHPSLTLEEYWHPILDPNTVVTNSIDADLTTGAGNIIITGPNAGGKSTALKAIALAILLGQTFGIAPAKHMLFTPFKEFKTHLNIADTEGRESLFQAEMRRAQDLMTDIKRLGANEFSFTILDEIFTGTNPEEGQAGAYGVAKHLSQLGNSMCFVATHFKKLTELETTAGSRYKNYKVSVVIHDTGAITPTYKLTPGISDQKIALQLLQNAGFGSDVLNAAHEVMGSQKHIATH